MKIREVEYNIAAQQQDQRASAEEIIEEIDISLDENAHHLKYPGYGNGLLGVALFYAYYSKYRNDKKFELLAIEYFQKSIAAISFKLYDHKIFYFRELIEIGLFIQFVKNEDLLDQIDTSLLPILDVQINTFFKVKVKEGELNHFGALFAGEYFLTRMNEDEQAYGRLEELVMAFERFATKSEKGYSWKWPFSKGDGTYLGMICGSSRIITLLSSIHENDILKSECHHLISNATDFILNNEQEPNPGYFPIKVEFKHLSDFLLDGDLAVACGLLKTYKITRRDDVMKVLDRTLKLCCSRRNYDDCRVGDASILYGTTGLAFRFDRLYRETQAESLKDTADFWYAQSIHQRKLTNETAGFRAKYNKRHTYTNIAFHEGIAGIGIGLMCFLNSDLPLPTKLIG